MGKEIERKFLVNRPQWEIADKPAGQHFRQGYILTDPQKTIRVRLTPTAGFLTIKGASIGATRLEYEYGIPMAEATELLDNFAISELSKIRYKIPFQNNMWEVDVFLGTNEGLIVGEIELETEDEQFALPPWVGKEVTEDEKYYNSNLTIRPYNTWDAGRKM